MFAYSTLFTLALLQSPEESARAYATLAVEEDAPASGFLLDMAREVELDLRDMRDQPGHTEVNIRTITPEALAEENAQSGSSGNPFTVLWALTGAKSVEEIQAGSAGGQDDRLGFYESDTKTLTLVVRPGLEPDSLKLREVLAHELCHALDDEESDISGLYGQVESLDQAMALRATLEGAAMACAEFYMQQWKTENSVETPELDRQARAEQRYWRREMRKNAPPAIDLAMALFPYSRGAGFLVAGAQIEQTSFRKVASQALTDIPDSTEQILHPERYWRYTDAPRTIPVESLAGAIEATGSEELASFTYGELAMTMVFQGEQFDPKKPKTWTHRASTGWDGDTLVLLGKDGEWSGEALWYTTWDSSLDRDQFLVQLQSLNPGVPIAWFAMGERDGVVTFGMPMKKVVAVKEALEDEGSVLVDL